VTDKELIEELTKDRDAWRKMAQDLSALVKPVPAPQPLTGWPWTVPQPAPIVPFVQPYSPFPPHDVIITCHHTGVGLG
jgi:hypothetical protein